MVIWYIFIYSFVFNQGGGKSGERLSSEGLRSKDDITIIIIIIFIIIIVIINIVSGLKQKWTLWM
jgi:hypothetical protein